MSTVGVKSATGILPSERWRQIIPRRMSFRNSPYRIEILESNGSSSMASVCGGFLSLMDAGVKILQRSLVSHGLDH